MVILKQQVMDYIDYERFLYEDYLDNQDIDKEPTIYFVVADGGEIVFTTTDLAEATEEYNRVVILNEAGDSDDYAVDLMSCDGDYYNEKQVIKTLGYSDTLKSWNRN